MDLKEARDPQAARHPWETARVKAVAEILRGLLREGISVLDVGCGDGYLGSNLLGALGCRRVVAVDINLSRSRMEELQSAAPGFSYRNRLPEKGERFDLTLLLDVVEHVSDDRQFLEGIVTDHVASEGEVLLTVPAFQFLYSRHDRFLGHERRYRLKALEHLVRGAGLQVVSSGYLFGSLLLPKLLLFKFLRSDNMDGIGRWQGGRKVSAASEKGLHLENRVMIAAARRNLKLPGLSAWALCRRSPSGSGKAI